MKMRMTITTVVEYEPDPVNYADTLNKAPEDVTAEDVIKVDTEAGEEDPSLFMEGEDAKTTVVVERIE